MHNSIVFETAEGEKVTFYIEEETRINGISYLLVSDSDKNEASAYILKDTSSDDDAQARYVMVDDDEEFGSLSELFSKMMDDVELI